MIWRVFLLWLLGVSLASVGSPRRTFVDAVLFYRNAILQFRANENLTNDSPRVFSYGTANQLTDGAVAGQWRVHFGTMTLDASG
jgi:hypothetical protein